jgi:acetyltransferase-like isoleucine patch superfamily enzyme
MNTIFTLLSTLNRDNAPHRLLCLANLVRRVIGTGTSRLLARWWGVSLGANCAFHGLPLFRRSPGSRLRIGDHCEFRSAKWSNTVGVNRPCILTTAVDAAVLEIGSRCGFTGTVIGCASNILIGDRVLCGANVTITDTDWHPIDPRDRAAGLLGETKAVIIGDDVWLGMNVTVLKGVEIGSRTVVASGSLVTRSLPAGVIAAGQPARVVRTLTNEERNGELQEIVVGGGNGKW